MLADLLLGMLGRDKEAEPRQAFRHRRIEDRLHVDALPEQRGGDAARSAAESPTNDRNHRRVAAVAGVQPAIVGQRQKQLRAISQPRHALRLLPEAAGAAPRRPRRRREKAAVAKTNAGVVYFKY